MKWYNLNSGAIDMTVGVEAKREVPVFSNVANDAARGFVARSIFNTPSLAAVVPFALEKLRDCKSLADFEEISKCLAQLFDADFQKGKFSSAIVSEALVRLRMLESQFSLHPAQETSAQKAVSEWTSPVIEPDSRALSGSLPFVRNTPLISKETPIGAAGSCFATEITAYLKENNYNYVVTEANENSCADWGGLYNSPSFRQLIEAAFGLKQRPRLLFECEDTGKKEFWDPYREGVFFKSIEDYEESTRNHLNAAKEALMKTKVFIMTVGLNEVWRLAYDDSVLARYPRTLASHLVHKQILTVDENVAELQRMLDVWRTFNPDLKIIITVSPVPLYATFRAEDSHVISATCHSKSVLRLAVDQFVKRNPGIVSYFPAFEVVSYCASEPWTEDCRHVTRATVGKVMDLFEKTFLQSK